MAHPHVRESELTPREIERHQRALRILVVVLIPLGVWTLAGLIALWPGDVSDHVDPDLAGFSVPGVTYPVARITAIEEMSCDGMAGSTPGVETQTCAAITVKLAEGAEVGQSVTVPLTDALYASGVRIGQDVKLIRVPPTADQPAQYQFNDFERRTPLLVLTLLFAAAVVAVARWRGLASLLGLGFAGFILVKFMFPALVAGENPIMVGLIGSSAIMFVVLYAAHGFSARTSTALVGTLFGLISIAALGYLATRWAHLTGVSSEDDYVLAASAPDLRLTSVVLCGIIVAGLGVLNDVTITQASAVWELADTDPDQRRLFARAMRIGRDHIASTVYTIAFATAGAALPVLLLIAVYDRPLLEVIQGEQFAGEVIRTLVGSVGLVLAVPLTTAVGVAVVRASNRRRGARATVSAGAGHGDRASGASLPTDHEDELGFDDVEPHADETDVAASADTVAAGGGSGGRAGARTGTAGPAPDKPVPGGPVPGEDRRLRVPAADRRTDGGRGFRVEEPDADAVGTDTRGRHRLHLPRRRPRRDEDDFGDFSNLREDAPLPPLRPSAPGGSGASRARPEADRPGSDLAGGAPPQTARAGAADTDTGRTDTERRDGDPVDADPAAEGAALEDGAQQGSGATEENRSDTRDSSDGRA